MSMIFDSHAHYDDEAFDGDRDELLQGMMEEGIGYIVNAGANINSSKASLALAEKFPFLYAAVGIHPQDAGEYSQKSIETLRGLARYQKVVAIGEIGLDYYYEGFDKELQKKAFEEQVKLAMDLGLPVIIHDREAHKDTFDILKKYACKGLKGVLHCYSGSAQMARDYVNMGFYIGFTGVITFKNAKKALEVLEEVPLNRILIETDCPYLAPVPYRGKRNDSRYLKYVVEKASETLGLERDSFIEQTCINGKTLFGI